MNDYTLIQSYEVSSDTRVLEIIAAGDCVACVSIDNGNNVEALAFGSELEGLRNVLKGVADFAIRSAEVNAVARESDRLSELQKE